MLSTSQQTPKHSHAPSDCASPPSTPAAAAPATSTAVEIEFFALTRVHGRFATREAEGSTHVLLVSFFVVLKCASAVDVCVFIIADL